MERTYEEFDEFCKETFDWELMPREINAILAFFSRGKRIYHKDDKAEVIVSKHIHLDTGTRQCWVRSKEVHLTPHEFELLKYLVRRVGKVCTYQQMNTVLYTDLNSNNLSVCIGSLRKKIDPKPLAHGMESLIRNIHGVGYMVTV